MLNINYTYYNNYKLLEEVVKHYEDYNQFKFTIIDDGSKREPISRDMVPSHWTVYRVEEDRGWGNEVCRNILMRETNTEWNALMDLDYVITKCPDVEKIYEAFKEQSFCFQFESGRSVEYNDYRTEVKDGRMINSFIVSRSAWHDTCGYDMSFGYLYGYDHTFFEQLDREIVLPDSAVKKIASQGAPEDWRLAPGDQTAFKDIKDKVSEFVNTGFYKQGIGWTKESERLKRCIDWPAYKELP
jgi:hypothetical protein